jgi:hypothetical protein
MADAALRLLRAYLGRFDEAVVGGLPDAPKLDVPLMPGSEILGSVVHKHPAMVSMFIDAKAEPAEIVAFYEREYASRGWRPQLPNVPSMHPSGFASAPEPRPLTRVFCKGETEPYYQLTIVPQEPRIHLSWHAVSQGIVHPCSSEAADPRMRMMHGPPTEVIPLLEGPPGVAVRPSGSGGSSDEWSTYGSALTKMPASELMDHFVNKIAAQGHDLIERGAGDRVSWSRWRMKKKGWEGFLIVVEQRADIRHLMFLSYTEGAVDNLRQWQSFSGGWTSRRFGG